MTAARAYAQAAAELRAVAPTPARVLAALLDQAEPALRTADGAADLAGEGQICRVAATLPADGSLTRGCAGRVRAG